MRIALLALGCLLAAPVAAKSPKRAATAAAAVPKTMDGLDNYNGIYFDRETLHTYVYRCPANNGWGAWHEDDCKTVVDTGYTFESATWRSGIDAFLHLRWPWLNPLDFATQETARLVLEWVRRWQIPGHVPLTWSLNEERGRVTGPFTRTTQWMICGANGARVECFSAGQIANKLIRQHPDWAAQSWQAEVTQAFAP